MLSVILIEPETSGNVGAIARVMKNFDFDSLILVDPKCEIDEEAKKRAKHAGDVLENAEIASFDILDEFDYLVATTSKIGRDYNILRSPMDCEDFAISCDFTKKVGLVLGREGKGLYNEEIAKCDFVVSISSSVEYPVMNLSHACAILLYEIFKNSDNKRTGDDITPISADEKKQIMKMIDDCLNKMDFLNEEKKETQRLVWNRLFSKAFLSKREAFAVMGFLRKITEM